MTDKIPTFGSKAQVFHLHAKKTRGGLTRKDLFKNKHGRIVSKKQHQAGKRAVKRLFAAGYKPKKGTFKLFHKGSKKHSASRKHRGTRRSTRRRRGGFADASGNHMNPMEGVMKAVAHSK